MKKEEILKHGSAVFNWVHASKTYRAVPKKQGDWWSNLTNVEREAITLWCNALYGEVTEETKWLVHNRGFDRRTVEEFMSGDPDRIATEREYIETYCE